MTSYNPASHQMLISANSHIALLHLMHSPSPFVAKVSALVGAAVILGGGGEDVRRQGTSLLSEGEGDEEGRERERLLVLNDKLLSEVVEAYAATLDGRPYPPNSSESFCLFSSRLTLNIVSFFQEPILPSGSCPFLSAVYAVSVPTRADSDKLVSLN